MADDDIIELARTPRPGTWGRRGKAGTRYVRTPEGAEKYGLPMGAPITRDAIERAQRRGRSYNVPEDGGDFGTTPPAAGRTKKNASEMVRAIRSAPAPKVRQPDGPKKIAVGSSGYGFPEGSRTFRPKDHKNFAIVRTPDYELVVVTDKGIAFDLEGDLERELNEELDDDASLNFDADEPNELVDIDGDGKTAESSAADGTAPLAARPEDMPGYLDDEKIKSILDGMRSAGLDDTTLNAAELQLIRNNDKIRKDWESQSGSSVDSGNEDSDVTDTPGMEKVPSPTPDRQPDLDEPKKPEQSETKDATPAPAPKNYKASSAPEDAPARKPEDELKDLEELARNRSTGTSEGRVAGTTTRLRRNRVDDSIEYEVEDDEGNTTPSKDRAEVISRASEVDSARRATSEASRPQKGEVVTMSDGRRALVIERGEDGVRVHLGDRGEVTVDESSLTREREWNTEGAALADAPDDTIQDFLADTDGADGPGAERRAARRGTPRDTTGTPPSDMTDRELEDALADLDDFARATGNTTAVRRRRAQLGTEWQKRNPLIRKSASRDDAEPEAPKAQTKLSSKIWGDQSPRLDRATRAQLGIEAGQGDFTDKTVDRRSALDARPGDKFIVKGGRSQQVWEMDSDGQFHNRTLPNATPLSREDFGDVIDDDNAEVYTYAKNRTNKADRAELSPGDVATDTWAKEAPNGAAAYSGDGLVQERKQGVWETPIGPVDADTFAPSDVADDDSVVARAAANADGRPVGSTNQIFAQDDLDKVVSGDGVTILLPEGQEMKGVRKDDGSFDLVLDSGLTANVPGDQILMTNAPIWHVPNRDIAAAPSRTDWAPGDSIETVDDILAQKPGTKLRYQYLRPLRGRTESEYTVLPDGEIRSENETVLPASRISKAVANGQVSVASIPTFEVKAKPAPRVVATVDDYTDGDKIADYRHLRAMKPGQTVTLVVPSHLNGGQEAKVSLTRTDDNKVMGGFMFLVGRRGRGYNSLGENNASLFQAIADGRLYFGDLNVPEDEEGSSPLSGAWDATPNIDAWKGGPQVSQADLHEFVNSQVYSPAMQTSYFDMSMLSPTNPFRQKTFRDQFADHAMKEFGEPGNPMRHKPASIRFAAQKLGLKFTDPGSTLIPDDLDMADFKTKVTIGRWLRRDRNGKPLGKAAEENMGPEQIDVTAADLKTAFAAMDAMLERNDGNDDPDVILKRVFTRQGSPLQDLNVAVALASYYGMRRYRVNPDGSETVMTTIARQKDKRRNKELLRQMLREQLEGREPGFYGLPKDETYSNKNGQTFVNRTTLSRPAQNSDNAPDDADEAQGPATPERLEELNNSISETNDDFDPVNNPATSNLLDADNLDEIGRDDNQDPTPEPTPDPAQTGPDINTLRADDPTTLYLTDRNGNVIQPSTDRHIPADWDRAYVYDRTVPGADRQGVFEVSQSDEKAWIDAAQRLGLTPGNITGKRLFITDNGNGVATLSGDLIENVAYDPNSRAMDNLIPALVGRGGRVVLFGRDATLHGDLSRLGMRHVAAVRRADGTYDAAYSLNPDYIGHGDQLPNVGGTTPTMGEVQALSDARQAFANYEKQDFHMAADKGRAGDGRFKGTKLWGKYGAAGLIMRHTDAGTGEERFLLVQRAGKNKNSPLFGKWQLPGGGLDQKETDAQGAARETIEELNPPPGTLASLKAVGNNTFNDKSGWHYANLTADIPEQFAPQLDKKELSDSRWVTRAEIAQMESNGELHPALSDSIRDSLATYGGSAANALPTQKPTNQPSIFGAKPDHGSIKDPNAKAIPGTRAGSNGGQQWDLPMADGTTGRYFVKPVKSVDQGKQEALAADLYRLAGARSPEADYSSNDRAFYSKMMDLRSRGGANAQDLVREDFAADAWLANWDVRMGDNIMFDPSGNPVRLDNGGSMEYRATGAKKPNFGNTVGELDTLRQSGNIGANTFGARRAGQQDPWEAASAQKVVNVSDQDIRDLVTKHGLNQSLADTLIARRDDIAKRYSLTPAAPAAPAAPEASAAPEAPVATDTPAVARPRLSAMTATPLETAPAGMVPTRGNAVELTAPDGTKINAVVNTPKVAGHGTASSVTSKLYQELGIGTVEVDYDPTKNETLTTQVAEGPDAGDAGKADFRRGFVADAWLGNRAVGQQGKYAYDTNGKAIRVDNRGSLDMRLNGQKKPDFGNTVPELNSLRDPAVNAGAAALYGQRQNGNFDDFEFEGAQAVVDISPDRIRELVKEAGGDPSLATTLIARQTDIQNFYGVVPTGTTLPKMNPAQIDNEPSLADARRAVGGAKARYVASVIAPNASYLDTLKAAGNLDKAFENAWRARNPEKPDRITGGKVTGTAYLDDRSVTTDDIIDLAASFDFDPQLLADKAKDMNSNPRDPRVLHEVMAEQRGFHDTNPQVDPSQIDALVSSGQRHVFRTVNNHSSMTGVQAADAYKADGYWRRGNGAKAHGEGIYVSPTLSASLSYGHSNAGVIEMAFDEKGSKIAPSSQFRVTSQKIQDIKSRISTRTDLTKDQKEMLTRVFSDMGTAAMAMGYDALYGNATSNDFNVLNKSKVTFSDKNALKVGDIGTTWNATSADYRRAQQALQPSLQQSNRAQGNTPAAPVQSNAQGISSGDILQAIDLPKLGIGSVITVTRGSQSYVLRKTGRGWVNTATNRTQKWVDTMIASTPRGRTRFVVVTAN